MLEDTPLPNASPGATFALPDCPCATYVRCLAGTGNGSARNLLKKYEVDIWNSGLDLRPELECSPYATSDHPCAQIVDLGPDDTLRIWSTLTFGELYDPYRQVAEVDRFLDDLHLGEPDVSSRVLLFNDISCMYDHVERSGGIGWPEPYDEMMRQCSTTHELLVAHILGIEYDLKVDDVHRRLYPHSRDFFTDFMVPDDDLLFFDPWRAEGVATLPILRAYTLDTHQIGLRSVEHAIVQIQSPKTGSTAFSNRTAGELRVYDAKRPSEAAGLHDDMSSVHHGSKMSASDIFVAFLRVGRQQGLQSDVHLVRLHWLDASLRWMEMLVNTALFFNVVNSSRHFDFKSEDMRTIAEIAHSTLDRVETFLEQHQSHRRDDCEATLRRFKRLTKAVDDSTRMLTNKAENARFRKQMDMAELSISESRSAIGLTALVSVFVPIQLASSIFGMNLQEINHSGHGIWTFVICTLVLLLLTGAAWASWRASKNFKLARSQALSKNPRGEWRSESRKGKAEEISAQYKFGKSKYSLLYWLGFRRYGNPELGRV